MRRSCTSSCMPHHPGPCCLLLPHAVKTVKMLGDMEMVHCAQRDAPTMRRLSVDLTMQRNEYNPLRRLSTCSVSSTTSSSVSQSSSPSFSSSLPNTHGFWPEKMSGLFRTPSMPVPAERSGPMAIPQRSVEATADTKVPALIRSLSKGMDSFR